MTQFLQFLPRRNSESKSCRMAQLLFFISIELICNREKAIANSAGECAENPVSCGISKSAGPAVLSIEAQKNVFHQPLALCSQSPVAGYFRTGYCQTDETDQGVHTVCAVMNDEFLKFSKSRGNDLMTSNKMAGFPGLKSGQKWCVCTARWQEAQLAGKAPAVVLDATHEKTLESLPLVILRKTTPEKR